MDDFAIVASGISKAYKGKKILDDVSISLKRGKSAVLVGRNGAGKTTLLSILAGYLKPDAGTIQGEKAAFCPQFDDLFEDLTVRDNIQFWQNARGANAGTGRFDFAKIPENLNKRVRHLSGGMKKNVAIACALTGGENLLILDEPFAGLDIFYKQELLSTLGGLLDAGICVLYSAHNADEIKGLGSEIYILAGGKLTLLDEFDGFADLRDCLQ